VSTCYIYHSRGRKKKNKETGGSDNGKSRGRGGEKGGEVYCLGSEPRGSRWETFLTEATVETPRGGRNWGNPIAPKNQKNEEGDSKNNNRTEKELQKKREGEMRKKKQGGTPARSKQKRVGKGAPGKQRK